MISTPSMDKIVNKIWRHPNHENVTTLDDSSTEDFPVQPPIKQIEVVYLDSSESTHNTGNQIIQDNDETPAIIQEEMTADIPPANTDEQHAPPSTSPAKSSISSLHASNFYNPDEFFDDGGMWWGSHQSPRIYMKPRFSNKLILDVKLNLYC